MTIKCPEKEYDLSCSKDDFCVYQCPKVDIQSIRTAREGVAEFLKTALISFIYFSGKFWFP